MNGASPSGRRRRGEAAHREEPQRPGRHGLRLWCRRSLIGVAEEIMALQDALAERAREADGVYLPGYTHMQRAQPVLLAHHLLAHAWALARDVDRLVTTVDRLNISPLGAGALAGSSLPLDPDYVAAELGFHGRFENSSMRCRPRLRGRGPLRPGAARCAPVADG